MTWWDEASEQALWKDLEFLLDEAGKQAVVGDGEDQSKLPIVQLEILGDKDHDKDRRLITPADAPGLGYAPRQSWSSDFELPVRVVASSEPESSISPLPSPSSYLPLRPSLIACSQSSLPPPSLSSQLPLPPPLVDCSQSSLPSPSPSCYLPLPPSLIACSQWEKEECIGSGSFGHVYRGFNSEHGQFCAIKEVLVVLNDPRSKEQLKQLNQEICFLKLLSHPNIVQYYGSIMTNAALSIYMEYVSEGSIHVLLGKHGPFKESMIRNWTAQILSGLAYLHERRHIHRDIKGANILVGSNGVVKLADFGLAKHISTLTEVHTSNTGTPYWMAPEVIVSKYSGKGYNLSADIWSLGCTVVEMATGKHPLHGFEPVAAMFKIASDTYEPEIPDKLSDEGKDFLLQCFRRDPRSRPTATQLMDHPFVREYRAAF